MENINSSTETNREQETSLASEVETTGEQESSVQEVEGVGEQESSVAEAEGGNEQESSVAEAEGGNEQESVASEAGNDDNEGKARETTWVEDLQVENDATVAGTLRAHAIVTDMADAPEKNGTGFYSSGAAYNYTPTHIGIDDSRQADEGIVGLSLRNAAGKVLGAVAKLYTGISEKDKSDLESGSSSGISQLKAWVENALDKLQSQYLSKEHDDTTDYAVSMGGLAVAGNATVKGSASVNHDITVAGTAILNALRSSDYNNTAETGFSIEKDSSGRYQAFLTNLTVWGKALFNELEIRKLSYSGGDIYLSGAGSKIIKAVPVKKVTTTSTDSDGNTYTTVSWTECEATDTDCAGWKCYLLADDGTTATMNYWQEGDQARCRTMGEITSAGTYEKVSNRSYWRTIPDGGVSSANEKIYGSKTEAYTDADGNVLTRETVVELYDGQRFAWIVLGKHSTAFDGVTEADPTTDDLQDCPAAGDTIVLDGNRHRGDDGTYDKTDRQNVITLETTGTYAPRIACYANITEYKHTVTSSSGEETSLAVFETSPSGGTKINSSCFEWTSSDGTTVNIVNYRGDWTDGTVYHKNDEVNYDNAMWICIANSGVSVTEKPSDTSSYWKKVLSGGKGEDAVTYEVQVSSYSEWVNGGRAYGLQFQFVKVTGATRQTVSDVREIGCMIKITTPAYIYTGAASYINEGNSHFLFSTYPVNGVAMNEADNITVKMSLQSDTDFDNPVAVANFANGKQGKSALEISVSPDTLTFDTNDNGLVDSSTVQKATITCTRDGADVTGKCTFSVMDGAVNCTGTFKATDDANVLTVGSITYQTINGQTVSNTNGYVNVKVTDEESVVHTVTVRFTVNVAKFNSSMVANNEKLQTQFSKLTNNGSITDLTEYRSEIEQTARNISLKVQEKNVGRRNMLTGSAFRKQEDGIFKIMGGFISINNGYEGTNCVHAVNTYSGSQNYYGVFWDGSQGSSSIKIDRTKKYVLSCWVKSDRTDVDIYLETVFTDKQTSASRVGKRPKVDNSKFGTTAASTWELIEAVIDPSLFDDGTTKNTQYEYMAVNIFCTHTLSGVTCHTYICRPMLEEGDEYNGWTQSEQDYDYVGGNLLDNTAKLTKGGNLSEFNGDVVQGGYGESASITRTLPTDVNMADPLVFTTSGMGLKAGEDYILSFYAKASTEASAGRLQCYLYSGSSTSGINTEDSTGTDNSRNPSDGSLLYGIVPTTSWKRYWVHWRPTGADKEYIRLRVMQRGTSRGSYSSTETYAVDDVVLYDGTYWRCTAASKGDTPSASSSHWEATIYNVSIAQPKLEVGATMTEWTEKRADMVDKQALLATGIDIENKLVTVTADNFKVQNNSGTETMLVGKDGKLTTSLIDADTVVANGIKTQVLEAQNLTVSGNSKFGIWSIGTDDTWGDVIQAKNFTDANGTEYTGSMTQYSPSFVRGGSRSSAYMRVGPYTAEFGQYVDSAYNGMWFGYAARIVCQGSTNSWDLPTLYKYNSAYSPTAYIYSGGKGENPAFAINRPNGGTALQTNGAVRCKGFGGGVVTVSSSTTLDNNAYFVRCTNSSAISVTLPTDPVEGQTVIIVQAGASVSIYGGGKSIWANGKTGGTSLVTSGLTGQFNLFVYDGTRWNATMMNGEF